MLGVLLCQWSGVGRELGIRMLLEDKLSESIKLSDHGCGLNQPRDKKKKVESGPSLAKKKRRKLRGSHRKS